MDAAKSQEGIKEVPENKGKDILKYQESTGNGPGSKWCSSFVNWCLEQAGIEGTNSGRAFSWLSWGDELTGPAYGAIGVLKSSHVGFVAGMTEKGDIILLGGNQSNCVSYKIYPLSSFKGFVYPHDYDLNDKPLENIPLATKGKRIR
jgi:uncharacterized protein (TIGR02594 family)